MLYRKLRIATGVIALSTMTTTTSPELPRCDTELSLGLDRPAAPAPARCRATTGELKQKQAAATELQAMAILHVARQAAAADEGASGLSMRRSMEWFLQRRRESRRQRGVAAGSAAASPSSSSSCSCLTDSSWI